MNMFAELKRRNVIRAAGLYLVGAWLLVQVSSTILPMFSAPDWLPRSIVIALAIGFVPMLVFAWVFELTPTGIQRDEDVPAAQSIAPQTARRMDRAIIVVLACALAYFAVDKFVMNPRHETANDATRQVPAAVADNSIAVLAFSDLSQSQDQALFSEGMAEEILNALTRIKSLRVLGRSSSFQFLGKNIPPPVIAQQLGVAHVLTGSVRKQGNELRITVELVRATDGVQQWSNQYDGSVADVFKLQDACAHDVASQLDITLSDAGARRLVDKVTDNPQAYAQFIEAQELVTKRFGDSLPRAIALLDEATRLDPHFARAWSTLAVAYAVLPQYGDAEWTTSWLASDQAAHHALTLNPDDADAYAALSYNQFSQRHYTAMVQPMQHALELAPENSAVNYWAANELASMGRSRDAEMRIDVALANDPANILLLFYKSMMRWRVGDQAGAFDFIHRHDTANSPFGGLMLGLYDAAHGDKEAAVQEFTRSTGRFGTKIPGEDLQAIYLGTFGDEQQRQMALKTIGAHLDDQWAPALLLQLDEPMRSFDLYEHGHSGLSDGYLNWLWQPEPWSRKARQERAFQGFAKHMGMVDYWKRYGWPDLCHPAPAVGPDVFTCQ